ncbi:MAG: hypothetical protein KZQ84_20350, partial [Candidatus Thiodiazotropha sp. (ex Lucinoma borealis)]|nr:hypothetical protein [Candidatus Thiodiazotropha sp. (ex Lucinoma borealis)]
GRGLLGTQGCIKWGEGTSGSIGTVFIIFNMIQAVTQAKIREFATGFVSHIGSTISSHMTQKGIYFKIRSDLQRKATTYMHMGIETHSPSIVTSSPVFSTTNLSNVKPGNNQKRNDASKPKRSYAILDQCTSVTMPNLKSIFDFSKNGITDAIRIKDKRGMNTRNIKLTFNVEKAPTKLYENTPLGISYDLDPCYMQYVRCNFCQRFGHPTKACKSRVARCPHCAGNHQHAKCKNKKNRHCVNCGFAGHGASYWGCGALIQYQRKINDMNDEIYAKWYTRVAAPNLDQKNIPRSVAPVKQHSIFPQPQPIQPLPPTFSMEDMTTAIEKAKHEAKQETLHAVADMLGTFKLQTENGLTLTADMLHKHINSKGGTAQTETQPDPQPELEEGEILSVHESQDEPQHEPELLTESQPQPEQVRLTVAAIENGINRQRRPSNNAAEPKSKSRIDQSKDQGARMVRLRNSLPQASSTPNKAPAAKKAK